METPTTPARAPWLKPVLYVAGALALAAVAYTAYWHVMANRLEAAFRDWLEARRAEGVTIAVGRQVIDGFPTRLRLGLDRLDVAWPGRRPIRWRVPEVLAEAPPWRLQRVRVRLFGQQRIEEGEGPGAVVTEVVTKRLEGRVGLFAAGADLHVVADGFVAERAGQRLAAAGRFDLDLKWRPLEGAQQSTSPLRFDLGADAAELPVAWTTPFGRELSTVRFGGHLTGPLTAGPLEAVMRAWRDAGGTLEIERLAGTIGPLKLETKGTFALDPEMQPEGAFSARAEGYIEAVDALVQAGLMKPTEGTAAKLVLAVIAKRPAGKVPYVETPLTLQDRVLSAGPLRLARVARLDWQRLGQLVLPGRRP
jgi:hypothetical protein